jgi:SEC-C motif-containing protein
LITNSDLDWLEIHYSGMIYIPAKNILRGCLWFRMIYYPAEDICVIDPEDAADFAHGVFIEDAYELDIEFNGTQSKAVVKETTGRIKWSAAKWGKTLSDIHVYSDSSLCLCPKPEEELRFPSGLKLRDFFNKLLVPNLFYQSYFEKYGKEPWKGSSHDDSGILESYDKEWFKDMALDNVVSRYLESLSPLTAKLITDDNVNNRNLLCICHSNKKFQDCHKLAFSGLRKLYRDYWKVESRKPQRVKS